MLILGVDTSGRDGSIALVRFSSGVDAAKTIDRKGRKEPPQSSQRETFPGETSQTLGVVTLEGGAFSAELVPQIAAMLHEHGVNKYEIDAFAVVSGPGSFTGLRVGLAAIKGLAEALQKPIAAVSLLEAVAIAAGQEGRLTAVLDAGRGEVYVGVYEVADVRAKCVAEKSSTIAALMIEAAGQQVVTPDQKIAEALAQSGTIVSCIDPPNADGIAWIGFQKLERGEVVSPEALDATYIRRTDAEIKLAERTQ
jgi:tRNA threonylcarbamoyladenosine biosynthesis protein TsaB